VPEQQRPIVIVEDDAGLRRAMERLFRIAGYATAAFESAEALLETDAASRAACLVLDIRLPGVSGFELQDQLAREAAAPPVVMITAHDEPANQEAAARAGVFAFLLKPFAGSELLATVARAIAA
jgi:FixJ family two-component response regulator